MANKRHWREEQIGSQRTAVRKKHMPFCISSIKKRNERNAVNAGIKRRNHRIVGLTRGKGGTGKGEDM